MNAESVMQAGSTRRRRQRRCGAFVAGLALAASALLAQGQEIPDQPGAAISVVEVGTVTYAVHVYQNVGTYTFTPPAGVTEVDVLIVAGGGGGGHPQAFGNAGGGGGGAGGVIERSSFIVGTTPITVAVGAGGAGGVGGGHRFGDNGENSSFGALVALGGGGGAAGNAKGRTGGSGGGSRKAEGGVAAQPGSLSGGLGHRGGDFLGDAKAGAGASGGGGAGGPGVDGDATNRAPATNGGPGMSSSITGTATRYAGGGGGGGARTNPFGSGRHGGGDGANTGRLAEPGDPNTGGGGGGGSNNADRPGAAGGSGIVIVRYDVDLLPPPPPPDSDPEPDPDPVPEGLSIAQVPQFLSRAVPPQVMLTLSNDHQLYFKAYDDYSDLTGDGQADSTYVHAHEYYGYFDPQKCYDYDSATQRYVPKSVTANRYCDGVTGAWSGNFLNWVSMARIDTVRKMLYGGARSTDESALTVLERTYVPTDGHAWAKYYNGNDIHRLTPFTGLTTGSSAQTSGITFCNTSEQRGVTARFYSQELDTAVDAPPLIRVVAGNYSLWGNNEVFQCRWFEDLSGAQGTNGNVPATSGINAASLSPRRVDGDDDDDEPRVSLGNGLRRGEFVARVQACVEGLEGTERCKRYPGGNLKPVGILQQFGDEDRMAFGLLSGSYGKNMSGGVLRKNVESFRNEVEVNGDGTFKLPAGGSVIAAIDSFRIYGYRQFNGDYWRGGDSTRGDFRPGGSDNCRAHIDPLFAEGDCSNWGNPQAELFLESLRYFGGHSPTPAFAADDSTRFPGLLTATWDDPLSEANYCAPLNVIQFNASITSFDNDQLGGSADIGLPDVKIATNAVGAGEGIHGAEWFIGDNGTDSNGLCTAKTITALGEVAGTCPEAPRLGGSFNIAGLAHHAWTKGIRTDLPDEQFVRTYGISLAPDVPRVEIPVPGSDRTVTIQPACRNQASTPETNCTIMDFKIVAQDVGAGTGQFFVAWEDAEAGSDFDLDTFGIIKYEIVGGSVLRVTTQVVSDPTNAQLGFGYVLSGTAGGDGFRVHSGARGIVPGLPSPERETASPGFIWVDPDGFPDCATGCVIEDGPSTAIYTIAASDAEQGAALEQPLHYAAKWGGFDKSEGDLDPTRDTALWDSDGDGLPDNMFFAIDPGKLVEGLEQAFLDVLLAAASASAVTTNSSRLDADAAVFQARFSSERWNGQLLAFRVSIDGTLGEEPLWDAAARLDAQDPGLRRIFTTTNLDFSDSSDAGARTTTGINFQWAELSAEQQNQLQQGLSAAELTAGLDEARLEYLRGDRSLERTTDDQSAPFRERSSALGDIINSNPQFVGTQDFGFGRLGPLDAFPDNVGGDYLAYRVANVDRKPVLIVGANDGMLHAFDGRVDEDNLANGGKELFAYVPSGVYANLHELSLPDYSHRYFVDGSPRVADAWLGASLGWRKVVAGTTGAGGRTVFMLDISDPDTMTASDVLWEFRHKDLGVTIGQPAIVALPNGRFGVVISSGYNNGSNGFIFILDAETGAIIKKLDTGSLTDGLGTPLVLDPSGDGIVDRIYVGDMEGRLWRFDLSGSDLSAWDMPAFLLDDGDRLPLFRARGPGGEVQAISAQPEAGRNPEGKIMLFFGTGTFFLNGDNIIPADPDVNSFYGIIDRDQIIANRSNMTEQEVLAEPVAFDSVLRVVSNEALALSSDGWYLDLVHTIARGGSGPNGERVTQRALLRDGRIIFPTVIPSANACDFGGTSFLMELEAFTGARIDRPVFDLDGDGYFDDGDMVTVIVDGEEVKVAPSGIMPGDAGLLSQPAILSAGDQEFKFLSGSTSTIEVITERGSESLGRQSWRELR